MTTEARPIQWWTGKPSPEHFDGENGCISPQLYPTVRLHGPEPRGISRWFWRFFRSLSRRFERREPMVVVGQARPDRR